MPKATFIVQPQRYNGRAWVACEVHHAEQWAVVRKQGERIRSVVARYSTKAMAKSVAASEARRALPYRPYPKPGARLPKHTTERLGYGDPDLDEDDHFLRRLYP